MIALPPVSLYVSCRNPNSKARPYALIFDVRPQTCRDETGPTTSIPKPHYKRPKAILRSLDPRPSRGKHQACCRRRGAQETQKGKGNRQVLQKEYQKGRKAKEGDGRECNRRDTGKEAKRCPPKHRHQMGLFHCLLLLLLSHSLLLSLFRARPPGLIQRLLIVLVSGFGCGVRLVPGSQLYSSGSLRLCPQTSTCCIALCTFAWICCPQLPHPQPKKEMHGTSFSNTGGRVQILPLCNSIPHVCRLSAPLGMALCPELPQRKCVTKILPNVRVNFLVRFAPKSLFYWDNPFELFRIFLVLFVRFLALCPFWLLTLSLSDCVATVKTARGADSKMSHGVWEDGDSTGAGEGYPSQLLDGNVQAQTERAGAMSGTVRRIKPGRSCSR